MAFTDITEFKNIHGGCCWILGNGKSLEEAPFDGLKHEWTFGVNGIANIFDKTDWRPDYFVSITSWYKKPFLKILDSLREVDQSFISRRWQKKPFFREAETKRPICNLPVLNLEDVKPWEARLDWWCDDPVDNDGFWAYATVVFVTIQLACYMGFEEINLLGMDLGLLRRDTDHFYSGHEFPTQYWPDEQEVWAHARAHEIARFNVERLGKQIYNCTPNNGLMIYEPRDARKVINNDYR